MLTDFGSETSEIDPIVGGLPCQRLSNAGSERMPTLSHHRGTGLPIIDMTVRYFPLHGVAHPSGTVPQRVVRTLIDTGATNVILHPDIVFALGLPYACDVNNTVVGASTHLVPAYGADIIFGTHPTTYTVTGVLVIAQPLAGFDMIAGWDVLRFVNWNFDTSGSFSLSW